MHHLQILMLTGKSKALCTVILFQSRLNICIKYYKFLSLIYDIYGNTCKFHTNIYTILIFLKCVLTQPGLLGIKIWHTNNKRLGWRTVLLTRLWVIDMVYLMILFIYLFISLFIMYITKISVSYD